MILRQKELDDLLEGIELFIQELRDEPTPDEDVDLMLARGQAIYAALAELQTWRRIYPNQELQEIFITEYGTQALQ